MDLPRAAALARFPPQAFTSTKKPLHSDGVRCGPCHYPSLSLLLHRLSDFPPLREWAPEWALRAVPENAIRPRKPVNRRASTRIRTGDLLITNQEELKSVRLAMNQLGDTVELAPRFLR